MDGAAPPPPVATAMVLKKPLKIVKVVRAAPVAAAPEEEVSPREQRRRFAERYGALHSRLWRLAPQRSLAPALEQLLVAAAPTPAGGGVAAAFDFDQTLHVREALRGGSRDALERLRALGVPFCIVTAAQPRVSSVKALAHELAALQLDHLFRTTALPRERALHVLRGWGDTAALPLATLQRKLLLLLALLTDRRAADLTRIGYSVVRVAADEQSAVYRMRRGPADWSGEQTLAARPGDARACPVAALAAYLARVHPIRPPPVYRIVDPEHDMPDDIAADDALFVDAAGAPLTAAAVESVIETFLLRDCGYAAWQTAALLREPAVEFSERGVQLARFGSLVAAKYNKAEAVDYYVRDCDAAGGAPVRHVLFVDDNIDNVLSVFTYFANRELAMAEGERGNALAVHSVWYEPPPEGHSEQFDAQRAELAHSIMRELPPDAHTGGAAAHVQLGAHGTVRLTQSDALAPLVLHATLHALSPGAAVTLVVCAYKAGAAAYNPLGYALDAEERPGCMGWTMQADAAGNAATLAEGASNAAFTLIGRFSITGRRFAVCHDAHVLAEGVVMASSEEHVQ